jgi:beta-lactamase regulating signal transducer with metallopeptidase domain
MQPSREHRSVSARARACVCVCVRACVRRLLKHRRSFLDWLLLAVSILTPFVSRRVRKIGPKICKGVFFKMLLTEHQTCLPPDNANN